MFRTLTRPPLKIGPSAVVVDLRTIKMLQVSNDIPLIEGHLTMGGGGGGGGELRILSFQYNT